jgi:hypothetical protein
MEQMPTLERYSLLVILINSISSIESTLMNANDTDKKDGLTDVTEFLEKVDTPEDELDENKEMVVLDGNGEEVTLNQ